MGIPYYVASLLKQHKHIQKNVERVKSRIFAIDFNCFIHHHLKASNPIGSVVVALHDMLALVEAERIYIAFDGLVPLGKMVQQRYRRMRIGETGPLGPSTQGPVFDKHQISPGTPYMKDLANTLRFLFPQVVISDTEEAGEGEHKIFTWLRTLSPQERESICIYGLDADLVVISVAQSSLGNIELLRETEERGLQTFSINALRSVLPIDPDMWVQTCVLCFGNDFMPSLAMFSLREDGYSRAMYFAGKRDFTEEAIAEEQKVLRKRAKESDRRIVSSDAHQIETRMGIHLFDGVLDWEPVVHAFWKTFAWTLHYFRTSEVLDWEWYYPYAEAPLLATLNDYPEHMYDFTWKAPVPTYTIADQLAFILPAKSLKDEPRFADELYREEEDMRHPWMKKFAWECDPWVSVPWGELTHIDILKTNQGC